MGEACLENKDTPINYYYSVSFQCYTSSLFYSSLLVELEYAALILDDTTPEAREIVWNRLFILCGGPKQGNFKSSKLISPVIKKWIEATSKNLLAIELLYLAFAISLNKFPEFFKFILSQKHFQLLQQNDNRQHERPPTLEIPTNNPHSTTIFPNITTTRSHNYDNPSRQKLERDASPMGNIVHFYPPYDNNSRSQTIHTEQKRGNIQPLKNLGDAEYIDVFKKLIDLQSWKHNLDLQPSEIQRTILNLLYGSSHSPNELREGAFTTTINAWARDIVPNMNMIVQLHHIVTKHFYSLVQSTSPLNSPPVPWTSQPKTLACTAPSSSRISTFPFSNGRKNTPILPPLQEITPHLAPLRTTPLSLSRTHEKFEEPPPKRM